MLTCAQERRMLGGCQGGVQRERDTRTDARTADMPHVLPPCHDQEVVAIGEPEAADDAVALRARRGYVHTICSASTQRVGLRCCDTPAACTSRVLHCG